MKPIHEQYEKLLSSSPIAPGASTRHIPQAGVYLFTENGTHLFVGRSGRLEQRYFEQRRESSNFDHASLANRITRAELNVHKAHRKDMSFTKHFRSNILRVAKMDFRYVEEADDHQQFLLEFYCAAVLETPYNHFRTT